MRAEATETATATATAIEARSKETKKTLGDLLNLRHTGAGVQWSNGTARASVCKVAARRECTENRCTGEERREMRGEERTGQHRTAQED